MFYFKTQNGHIEVLKYLLSTPQIAINLVDQIGWSALTYGIVNKQIEIVRLLVHYGASLKQKHCGWDTLMLAIDTNFILSVDFLVSEMKQPIKQIHFQIALLHNNWHLVTYLIKIGASLKTIVKFLAISLDDNLYGKRRKNLLDAIQTGIFFQEFYSLHKTLERDVKIIPMELRSIITNYAITHVDELINSSKKKPIGNQLTAKVFTSTFKIFKNLKK